MVNPYDLRVGHVYRMTDGSDRRVLDLDESTVHYRNVTNGEGDEAMQKRIVFARLCQKRLPVAN